MLTTEIMLPDQFEWPLLAIIVVISGLWILYKRNQVFQNHLATPIVRAKYRQTYRIRGVPLTWTIDDLEKFLASQAGFEDVTISSLATELQHTSCSATAFLSHPEPSGYVFVDNHALRESHRPSRLSFDKNFLGITTIYAPPHDNHKLDVIAISGIGGHAFGSFKERAGEYMWLRDTLPYDLTPPSNDRPMARVMTYGYDSVIANSKSFQNIEDIATQFIASLRSLAEESNIKPIMFIAHSLGGIIVKQALIILAKSKIPGDCRLLEAVYGIVFFGVPHLGMDVSSLVAMAENAPSRPFVESLSRDNSQILSYLQREFVDALGPEGKSEVVYFYEDTMSPTAVKDDEGKWHMNGPMAFLVSKPSATQCRPWESGPEHICAISRTHSDMVKFAENDHEYDKVRIALRGLAHRAVKGYRGKIGADTNFLVPYIENDEFVGRSNILKELRQQHGFSKRSIPFKLGHRVYLYGLGGVGKTQIALTYTHWLHNSNPDVPIYWVNASNIEQFRRSFLDIAQKFQIPGYDKPEADILRMVKDWLESEQRNYWLMVIDNADDMTLFFNPHESTNTSETTVNTRHALALCLPDTEKGVILITTRNKKLGEKLTRSKGHCSIEVDGMQDDEVTALFRKKLPKLDYTQEELSTLASRLEHLPLALVQAAAFMEAETMPMARYLDQLNRSDKHLIRLLSEEFEADGPSTSSSIAVTETLVITFEMIEKQHLFAGELLSLMGLFDREDIPQKFLLDYQRQKFTGSIDEDSSEADIEFERALGTLKAFSLMAEATTGNLNMHRLVQLVNRNWLNSKQRLPLYAVQALLIVSDNYPEGTFENRTTCSAYLPHATAVLSYQDIRTEKSVQKSTASLLHRVAEHLSREGKYIDSKMLLEQAIQIRQQVLGDDDLQTLKSMSNRVLLLWKMGKYEKGKGLAEPLIETLLRVLGEGDRLTLTVMNTLALINQNNCHLEESRHLFEQVLQTQKRLYGDDDPETLATGNNLGTVYRQLKMTEEAQRLHLSVVAGRKKVLGLEHPDTLLSMNNLAATYYDQKQLGKSEEIIVEVRRIQNDLLGEEHPETLRMTGNLAKIWHESGRYQEAIEMMEICVKGRQKTLGFKHDVTVAAEKVLRSWKDEDPYASRIAT